MTIKKYVSAVVLAAFVLFQTTALANVYDDFFKYENFFPDYGSISMDISADNTSDLSFLSCLDEYIKPYSAAKIAKGIFDSKLHLDINYETRKNRRILKAYIKAYALAPLEFNSDLYVDAKAAFYIWVHLDYTNSEKTSYQITVKLPTSDKYYVFDSKYTDGVNFYPAYLRTQTLHNGLENAVRQNSSLGYSDGKYSLTVTDSNLKGLISQFFENSSEPLYSVTNGGLYTPGDILKFREQTYAASQRMKNVGLLGASSLVSHFKFSEKGYIEDFDLTADLDTNIFKVYYASTGKKMPADPNAEKPAVNADNSDIKMLVNVSAHCTNEYTDFDFPTGDSIYNVYENASYSLSYTTDAPKVSPYKTSTLTFGGFPVNKDGIAYLPLRPLLNTLGLDDSRIVWSEGNIRISAKSLLPFETVNVTEGNRTVNADATPIVLSAAPISLKGVMYVPDDFVTSVIKGRILGFSTVFDDIYGQYRTSVRIEHLKPMYLRNVPSLFPQTEE